MADRTFSAEDVIRIYDLFLTINEQETVENFFRAREAEPEIPDFSAELEIIAEAIEQARIPLPGLFNLALRFFPFAATLVDTVLFAVQRADFLVKELLRQGEVDA